MDGCIFFFIFFTWWFAVNVEMNISDVAFVFLPSDALVFGYVTTSSHLWNHLFIVTEHMTANTWIKVVPNQKKKVFESRCDCDSALYLPSVNWRVWGCVSKRCFWVSRVPHTGHSEQNSFWWSAGARCATVHNSTAKKRGIVTELTITRRCE